jgi:hypothetical protein
MEQPNQAHGQTMPYDPLMLVILLLKVARWIANCISLPIEYLLRLKYGTIYFDPIAPGVSLALMTVLSAFDTDIGFSGYEAPETHLIRLTHLTLLLYFGGAIHNIRILRMMQHPEREAYGASEGPPWPLFRLLPRGQYFWPVRIVWEPLTVIVSALVLAGLHLMSHVAMLYLVVAGVALFAKLGLTWYINFVKIRQQMDAAHAAPFVAKFIMGTASEETLAPLHLAGIPKNLSPEIRAGIVAGPSRSLPPEVERLLAPKRDKALQDAA